MNDFELRVTFPPGKTYCRGEEPIRKREASRYPTECEVQRARKSWQGRFRLTSGEPRIYNRDELTPERQRGKLVFVDCSTNCVLTVGEALMPPVARYVFAETLKNIGTFHRREASMPPLLCFFGVFETDLQTAIFHCGDRSI